MALYGVMLGLVLIAQIQFSIETVNLSLGKPATQIGTWKDYGADRAVDGDTRQNFTEGSCAHPITDNTGARRSPAWWTVDLAANDTARRFVITNVTIYFRNDCCEERNINNEILVGDTPGTTILHTICARTPTTESIQTLPCAPLTAVRYLTIRRRFEKFLGLCEVIVNGYEYQPCTPGKWGENCALDCGCQYNCNDITGQCTKCRAGFYGKRCSRKCNCLSADEACVASSGSCAHTGCATGYQGANCSVLISRTGGIQLSTMYLVVGVLAAVTLCTIIIAVIVVIAVKRKYSRLVKDQCNQQNGRHRKHSSTHV